MLQIEAPLTTFSNDEIAAWTREMKGKRVEEYRKAKRPDIGIGFQVKNAKDVYGGPEMQPHILGWREGRLIYRAYTKDVDKHAGLHVLAVAWGALRLEQAAIILDAHLKKMDVSTPEKKELADKELDNWKEGDLQRACDDHGACATGEISDCMIIEVMRAEGHDQMINLPYRYHNGKTEMDWSEPLLPAIDEGMEMEGLIPNAIKTIRKKAGEMPELITTLMEMRPEAADKAVFRFLAEFVQEQELFVREGAMLVSGHIGDRTGEDLNRRYGGRASTFAIPMDQGWPA